MKPRNLLTGLFVLFTLLAFNPSYADKQTHLLNINNASIEQLESIKGIGTHKAQAIVEYRLQHGNFASVEDLIKVKGIGRKFITKNRSALSIE